MRYLNFNIRDDIISSINLSRLIKNRPATLEYFNKLTGKKVLIIGAGPSIENPSVQNFLVENKEYTTIVADGATELCLNLNVIPDFVVTDLDGDVESLNTASENGSILVVHSHGHNMDRIKNLIHKFTRVIGTTQGFPLENVFNFGGFSDGDRCVFLAESFKSKKLLLVGMDFNSSPGYFSKKKIVDQSLKMKKLKIAKYLLEMLVQQTKSTFLNITTSEYRSSIYGIRNYTLL